jgi:hypothetical protein
MFIRTTARPARISGKSTSLGVAWGADGASTPQKAAATARRGGKFRNLSAANLTGQNLSGIDLSGACLRGSDLTDANLTDAILFGADLR